MRLASYNIRKAVGLDWRRDPQRISDVLAEMDADIVVLQEADKRLGARCGVLPLQQLQDRFGYALAPLAVRPQSHGWHGNAIFFRQDLSLEKANRIDLPTAEPRGAVSVRFASPALEIIGVHLGLTPRVRRKQIHALGAHLAQATHPVIIAGDFNERKIDKTCLGPAVRLIVPGPTFHTTRPRAELDRFALSGGVHLRASHVHTSELARRASDHLPIVLDFDLEDT